MNDHARGLWGGRARLATGLAALAAAALFALAGCGGQTSRAASLRTGSPLASSASSGLGGSGGGSDDYGLVSSANESSGTGPSGVSGGALFGGNFPLVPEEGNLSRKLAIVRLYYFIGDAFPGLQKYRNLLAGGRTVLVSIDSGGPSYASIAAGNQDAVISAFLRSVNQAAVRYHLGAVYICFEHEPDNKSHRTLGSPPQFIQAWDHVHQLAESAHLDWNDGGRLHWVLILIHSSFGNWRGSSFWPGAGEVDIVAADGYNSSGCGPAHLHKPPATPADLFDPLVSFAAAHGGLPAFVTEWGSDDIPPGAQATFISQMQSWVAGHPKIDAALYWDTHVGNCDYKVDGNPASISALATMGQSAAMQGHVSTSAG